jgi:transcriptional regulator with XRE-family HTH domain
MGELIPFPKATPTPTRRMLWREAAGRVLREERHRQERTLADVAGESGVSTQHLSEVERGRKEASSEVLEALGDALGLDLPELARRVSSAGEGGVLALAA